MQIAKGAINVIRKIFDVIKCHPFGVWLLIYPVAKIISAHRALSADQSIDIRR